MPLLPAKRTDKAYDSHKCPCQAWLFFPYVNEETEI